MAALASSRKVIHIHTPVLFSAAFLLIFALKGWVFKVIKLLYSFYSYSLQITAAIFILCELIAFRGALGDTTTLLSQIGLMFTHLVGLGKLWTLVSRRNKIEEIKAKLQDKQYRYEPFDDFQPGIVMRKGKQTSMFLATFIFLLYSCVGVSAHISAVLMVNKNSFENTFIGNATCQSFTPYYYYYPFDTSTPTRCHYSLAYMDICLDIFAFYIATLDMVFVTLLHFLKTQLNILGTAMTNIRRRCLSKLKMDLNSNILYDKDCPELEEEMYRELTRCIKHLYSLLDIRNDIEDVFTFITLAQTLASLLIFASCLFVAARVPLTSPNFFAQIEYFSAVLSQFSVYCWFGNEMTLAYIRFVIAGGWLCLGNCQRYFMFSKKIHCLLASCTSWFPPNTVASIGFTSEALPSALYKSDWFACSPRFKRSMLLTITRMQRPLYVSIGKFTPMALTTLLGVIKGSFSYFTVFQNAGNVEQLA